MKRVVRRSDDAFSTSVGLLRDADCDRRANSRARYTPADCPAACLDQLAQLRFHRVEVAVLFGGHRVVIRQIGVVRGTPPWLPAGAFGLRHSASRRTEDRGVGAHDHRQVARIGWAQPARAAGARHPACPAWPAVRARNLRRSGTAGWTAKSCRASRRQPLRSSVPATTAQGRCTPVPGSAPGVFSACCAYCVR